MREGRKALQRDLGTLNQGVKDNSRMFSKAKR